MRRRPSLRQHCAGQLRQQAEGDGAAYGVHDGALQGNSIALDYYVISLSSVATPRRTSSQVEPTICALIYRGADARCVDKFGRTPLHIWCGRNRRELGVPLCSAWFQSPHVLL